MTTSKVALCNAALRAFGGRTVASLADGSKESRACAARFDAVRDGLLRAHPWNFAVRRVALAAALPPPAWGPAAAYPLPADCLAVLEVDEAEPKSWIVEGRRILSDQAAPLRVRYVARVDNVTQWDAAFAEAFAARLAAEIAPDVMQTVTSTAVQALSEAAERKLAEARQVDALEGTPPLLPDGSWLDARG